MVNKNNLGVALVDYKKMDEVGGNRVYWIDDYRVVLWQPMWLEVINERRRSSANEDGEGVEDSAAEADTLNQVPEIVVDIGKKEEAPDEVKEQTEK